MYSFDEAIEHDIIIAPHTVYDCPTGKLSEAIASGLVDNLPDDPTVLFVKPTVKFGVTTAIIERCKFAKQIAQLVNFVSIKDSRELKKELNRDIREGVEIRGDNDLISFWKLIQSIKHDFMEMFEHDANFATFLGHADGIDQVDGEGYVMWNSIGTYKLVDREVFSHANFNQTLFGRV